MFPRRTFIATSLAAALPAPFSPTLAQAWPSKPIRLVVGFAAGGASDIVGRLLSPGLGERLGQTIYVTERVGRCQREGGPIEEIRPGDRVFFEPGENHWHGAAPDRFMVHIAIQEADASGSPVTWGRHVSEEEYGQRPG